MAKDLDITTTYTIVNYLAMVYDLQDFWPRVEEKVSLEWASDGQNLTFQEYINQHYGIKRMRQYMSGSGFQITDVQKYILFKLKFL